ncbi:MAG: hypothetical protein WC867_07075 [Candidatus Pacearchaeota archaeon]|jgi:hypothetical protein
MNLIIIFIILGVILFFLIIFFVFVYFLNKKKESRLFDDESSGYFRKFFRRLNPFIFSDQEFNENMEGIGGNNENLKENLKKIMLSSNKITKDSLINKTKNKKIDELNKESQPNPPILNNKPIDNNLPTNTPEIPNKPLAVTNVNLNVKAGDKTVAPINPVIPAPKNPIKSKLPSKLPYEGPKTVNFETIVEAVKDEELLIILKALKEKYNKFLEKRTLNKNFNSYEELLDFLKNEIKLFLKDTYEALKSEISTLRRSGKDTNEQSIRLMSVPLKIKIYESNPSIKNFNNVLEIIGHIEEGINNLKK